MGFIVRYELILRDASHVFSMRRIEALELPISRLTTTCTPTMFDNYRYSGNYPSMIRRRPGLSPEKQSWVRMR